MIMRADASLMASQPTVAWALAPNLLDPVFCVTGRFVKLPGIDYRAMGGTAVS